MPKPDDLRALTGNVDRLSASRDWDVLRAILREMELRLRRAEQQVEALLGSSDWITRWGKLDEDLTAGGTATVSLWQATDGGWDGWDEDSGDNIEAYAPPLLSSGQIDEGKWVLVAYVNGRWVVVLAEC